MKNPDHSQDAGEPWPCTQQQQCGFYGVLLLTPERISPITGTDIFRQLYSGVKQYLFRVHHSAHTDKSNIQGENLL